MNRYFYSFLFAVLSMLPAPAAAQGIQQADRVIMLKLLPWVTAVGAAWCGVGLVKGFVKISNGDQDGQEQVRNAAIGAIGCTAATGLLALVTGWFK